MVCGRSVPCLCVAASSGSIVGRILVVWTVTALSFGFHGLTSFLFVSQPPPWANFHYVRLNFVTAVPSSSWTSRPMASSSSSSTVDGGGLENATHRAVPLPKSQQQDSIHEHNSYYWIPKDYCAPFGSYPNPLHLNRDDAQRYFAPVVQFPPQVSPRIVNHGNHTPDDLIPELLPQDFVEAAQALRRKEKQQERKEQNNEQPQHPQQLVDGEDAIVESTGITTQEQQQQRHAWLNSLFTNQGTPIFRGGDDPLQWTYGIGRYDEHRDHMYQGDLFYVTTTTANSETKEEDQPSQDEDERRTIHVGVDIDGPVGTPVHAIAPGRIHSSGYNPTWGDYGHVIVVEHVLPPALVQAKRKDNPHFVNRTFFVLYGHLAAPSSSTTMPPPTPDGTWVEQGHVIGHMGAFWDNGGWTIPHVHVQTSLEEPTVPHDLPGVVTRSQRSRALWTYFDPRYVLGPLYD